ncbi:Tyr recombinase domain-containing protein [Flavobacterium longum]|uniref:site-specific integrase n=1 Tax=Flavobacterium longum TaxID=1299340 RepID=UPI0039E86996
MNDNIFKILFVISGTRKNRNGLSPILCRITYLGQRKPFATGLFINPKNWYSKLQLAKPPTEEHTFINKELSLITNKVNQAFLFLQVQGLGFDVRDIYNQYAGVKLDKDRTILDVFQYHIQKQEKLIGIESTKVSVAKFYQTRNHVKSFLWTTYQRRDFELKKLKASFISDFEFYLKSEKKFKQHTLYKTIQRLRQMVKLAISLDYLAKDPFILHKNHKPKKEVVYLTPEELSKLETHTFSQQRLEQVRDMFVFCCYTGLAYTEMANLKPSNINKGFDGNQWIQMQRQKTQKSFSLPLLPKAKLIIEKYQDNQSLLPVISNQRFNSYIKEVAEIVGIEKNLTHHIARKTFATTVLLYNDVPMEIVSELLGHSKISITQEHYAKVVQKKVSEHMSLLQKKLK